MLKTFGPRAARFALVAAALPLNGCYLMHLAKGQMHVVCSTVDQDEALARPELTDVEKQKLRYIQQVRAFAEKDLHLAPSKNYTVYLPGEVEPVAYVVTAAFKDRLEPVTWWYPIVGTASYRGYFDREMAAEERDALVEEGYDASLRTASAFSTLGWFTDPVTRLMLQMDDGDLATLIIHELTHGTLYASGKTAFNESLAEFVGRQGATEWMTRRYGAGSEELRHFLDDLADARVFDTFMNASARKLDAFYASGPKDAVAERENVFAGILADFETVRPTFRTEAYRAIVLPPLNNAFMLGFLDYADSAPFERAFAHVGGDWTKFFDLVRTASEDDEPARKLQELVDE